MKIVIMQPYLFPYIGYWQLINAADAFVILDDVNFIKRGYINRNNILMSGKPYLFTIPVRDASQNRLIMDTKLCFDRKEKGKFLARIENAYRKAPYFGHTAGLIREITEYGEESLTAYAEYSIKRIADYLGIQTAVMRSSEIPKDNFLTGQDRIIEICRCLHADTYINPSGGRALYQRERFMQSRIKLYFLDTRFDRVEYRQYGGEFVGKLSIIDVLMFNPVERVRGFLEEYELNGR